jgi:hypothetical protein
MSGQGSASTLDLSEQQLVSCVNPSFSPYNGYGCNGGWSDNVSTQLYRHYDVVETLLFSHEALGLTRNCSHLLSILPPQAC